MQTVDPARTSRSRTSASRSRPTSPPTSSRAAVDVLALYNRNPTSSGQDPVRARRSCVSKEGRAPARRRRHELHLELGSSALLQADRASPGELRPLGNGRRALLRRRGRRRAACSGRTSTGARASRAGRRSSATRTRSRARQRTPMDHRRLDDARRLQLGFRSPRHGRARHQRSGKVQVGGGRRLPLELGERRSAAASTSSRGSSAATSRTASAWTGRFTAPTCGSCRASASPSRSRGTRRWSGA